MLDLLFGVRGIGQCVDNFGPKNVPKALPDGAGGHDQGGYRHSDLTNRNLLFHPEIEDRRSVALRQEKSSQTPYAVKSRLLFGNCRFRERQRKSKLFLMNVEL